MQLLSRTIAQILFSVVIACMFFICSCGKDKQTTVAPVNSDTAKIDVSNQYTFDASGAQMVLNTYDSQWRAKNFTTEEMALFSSMDTMDLSATTYPGPVTDIGFVFMYPNPFMNVFHCAKKLASGFTGQVALKMVVVDSMLHPLFKANIIVSSNQVIGVMPSVPAGKYRLYYTLSALAYEHFYKSWGNIQEL